MRKKFMHQEQRAKWRESRTARLYTPTRVRDIPPFVASPYSRDAIRSTNVNKNVSELFVNCPALFATCEQRGEQPAGSYVVLPSERRLDFLLVADVAFMK
jgi:hypothetical protein